ncbi:MAG: hypothetical protein WBG89_03890 [Ornithinimicrobium sp.]
MIGATQPAQFADFVHARTASLNRTAVLLVPDQDGAGTLLRASLSQARRQWRNVDGSPESRVRSIMTRAFVRAGARDRCREPRPDHQPSPFPSGEGRHLGDPLEGLSPRQRALTVLMAFHGQSSPQAARSLGVSPRIAAAEEAQARATLGVSALDELASILTEVAESFTPPDSGELVASVERQVQTRRTRRRRGWMAATGILAAVVVVGTTLDAQREGSGEQVQAPSPDADYDEGYGLRDGEPAPYLDGLALQRTEVIDYALRRKVVPAPAVEEDVQVYAAAYCDLPGNAMDVATIRNVITIQVEEDLVELSCLDREADVSTVPDLRPLPRGVESYTVSVPGAWAGAGAAHLAFYSEAAWSSYPFAPFQEDTSAPAVPGAREVVTSSTPTQADPQLEDLFGAEQKVHSIDVDVNTAIDITILTQEPGQLLVALDGVVVTNDEEDLLGLGVSRPGPWQSAEPHLRQGFWRGYSASGFHRSFDSGELARRGIDITDDRIVVSVLTRGFNGAGWQVIANTDGGSAPMALSPGYAPTLPEFAHGMRRVATFHVPTDGEPHAVPLTSSRADGLTWVGGCGLDTPLQMRTVTLNTSQRSALIPCASYRSEWADPVLPPQNGSNPGNGSSSSVTLTAPRTADETTLPVAAYAEVSYADFPFMTLGQPSTIPLNLRPVPDEGDLVGLGLDSAVTKTWVVRDSVTQGDLDERDTVRLTSDLDGEALLSVATEGRGRVRARVLSDAGEGDGRMLDGIFSVPSVAGRVASPLMYRDGWWTSWTTRPTRWTIPLPRALADGPRTVEIVAQDYHPGSLRIEVLEAQRDDDTLNG